MHGGSNYLDGVSLIISSMHRTQRRSDATASNNVDDENPIGEINDDTFPSQDNTSVAVIEADNVSDQDSLIPKDSAKDKSSNDHRAPRSRTISAAIRDIVYSRHTTHLLIVLVAVFFIFTFYTPLRFRLAIWRYF